MSKLSAQESLETLSFFKFLIVHPDDEIRQAIKNILQDTLTHVSIIEAKTQYEALKSIELLHYVNHTLNASSHFHFNGIILGQEQHNSEKNSQLTSETLSKIHAHHVTSDQILIISDQFKPFKPLPESDYSIIPLQKTLAHIKHTALEIKDTYLKAAVNKTWLPRAELQALI